MNKQLIHSLTDMHAFGKTLSKELKAMSVVYLVGDLGAGKTSLVQGIMQGLGYSGVVTSPTYNIIHEYPTNTFCVYHLDLYRLNTPEEAYELGLEEIVNDNSIVLIEWPEKGQGCIPEANYRVDIRTVAGKVKERHIYLHWH